MKKTLLLLIIILNYSCKSDSKQQLETNINMSNSESNSVEKNINKISNLITENDSIKEFDIEYIKNKTSALSKHIEIEKIDIEDLEKIPGEFIKQFIEPHKIDIGYPEYLPADYPEAFAFYEFNEYDDFYLYTFTYDDESCCRTLYAITVKKDNLKPINICVIGYDGGDGGWIGKKYGNWISEYKIENIDVSSYEEESAEPIKKIEIDTIWSEIQLSKKGNFNYIKHRKVEYVGNKQVK